MKTNALAIVAAAALAAPASAQLIAADSFIVGPGTDTYDAGFAVSRIDDNDVTVGSTGFTGRWTSGSANFYASEVGLTEPPATDTYAAGGTGTYQGSDIPQFRRAFRELETPVDPASTEPLYMSFLLNPGGSFGAAPTSGYALTGFTNFFDQQDFLNTGDSEVFGLQVGYKGTGAGGPDDFDLIVRARDTSGDLADFTLAPGVANATSLVVLKVEPTAAVDPVTFWVDPTDGSSEANLTATASQTGTFDTLSYDPSTAVDRLNTLTLAWPRSFFFDEPRYAFDLDSLFNLPDTLPGDANNDGTVDLADFGILRSEFGMGGGTLLADFNDDGTVDLADFGILRANFGASANLGALDAWYASVVPEPATVGLLGLGGLALLRRRGVA